MATRIQNAGFARITALLAAASWYIGFGTGTGQAASATALATAVDSRVSGTTSQQTTTVTSDTLRITGTVTAGASRAVTEAGVFDASTSGNMDAYSDFSVINLANGDGIAFTWNVAFS